MKYLLYHCKLCAIKYEKVLPLEKLARSLTLRENSLGISINDAKRLAHSLKYISKYKSIPGNYVSAKRLPSDSVNSIKLASASNSTFERMFVVPFRVSTWYYAYSGSEKYDVKLTLPFSKKIFGQSLNLPELVYQKYGSIYSQGDRTSTSTAPTSTLFTSSLNYSLPGLSIFVIFILLLDYIYCTVAKDSLFLLSFVGGFVWICAYNLAISDALTVLISHGLATSIILLFMLVLKLRRPQFLS